MASDLPDEVRALISRCIASVEQLEILLLLRREEGTAFSAQQVSDQLRTNEASVARRLGELASSGLLERNGGSPATYRYAPADPKLRLAVDATAREQAERPYALIDLIFAKPIDNLRVYSDAFRFRREDGDE